MRKKKVLSEDHMPETIGYSIHPTQIELYALWLLLNHVKVHKATKISRQSRELLMIHSRMLPLLLVWSRMIRYGLNA